jgi:hypothetical protein
MTLTSTDIGKIQELYRALDRLHAERANIKEVILARVDGNIKKGTSGLEYHQFSDFSPEASKEIRDVIARDIRRRAAKIVETLHKFGCEAKLTEDA